MIPLWIRIFHWVIAILFLLLMLTGITQHFASINFSLMDYSLATTIHEYGGISLSIVYTLFLLGLVFTGYWRKYIPRGYKIRRLLWGTSQFLGRNPAIIFIITPLIAISGLIYLYPEYLYVPEKVLGFDGLWTIAVLHYAVGIIGTSYTLGHIFMAFYMGTMRKIIYGRVRLTRMTPN